MASKELFWLAATALLTGSLWIPYIIDRMREHGVWIALCNPHRDHRPKAAWADRLIWAHANAVENLVVFGSLVLVVTALGTSTKATATAAAVFFFARLAHVVIYTAGIPLLRTIAFAVGYGAQVVLAVTALRAAL